MPPDPEPYVARLRRVAATHKLMLPVANRIGRKPPVLCIGDSHIRALRLGHHNSWRFHAIPVGGATMYGIASSGSSSGSLRVYQSTLSRVHPSVNLLFHLGEIDVGYAAFMLSAAKGTEPERIIDIAVRRYADFLSRIRDTPRSGIVAACSIMPPYLDYDSHPRIIRERRNSKIELRARESLTDYANSKLNQILPLIGVPIVDYAARVKAEGITNLNLRHRDAWEHHYSPDPFSLLLMQEWDRAFGTRSRDIEMDDHRG